MSGDGSNVAIEQGAEDDAELQTESLKVATLRADELLQTARMEAIRVRQGTSPKGGASPKAKIPTGLDTPQDGNANETRQSNHPPSPRDRKGMTE